MTDRRDRGQAITLNYTLGIAIATVLVTGLLIAGGGFVQDQRERAARAELRVIGQQIASDVEAADRLVASTDGDANVSIARRLPTKVAGSTYDVEVVAESDPYIRLTATDPDVEVEVEVTNQTAVEGSAISSSRVLVNYTAANKLALERGDT